MHPRTLTLAALLAAAAATVAANDWPRWRGPNNDDVCTETGLLHDWPTGGPPLVWTANGLGTGYGTPSVAGGKVFGIGSRDGKDGVWAVKESDGSPLWFTPFTPTATVAWTTNGPSSTRTVHNGKVYAVSLGGTLVCLDADSGRQVWAVDFVKQFFGGGRAVPNWGFNQSVLADGDKVICAPGAARASVVALKADTGEVIWKAEAGTPGGGYGYSSPIKATVAGVPMYVALLGQSSGLVGVHADTGKLLWQYNKAAMGGTAQIPTPIVKGDRVWVSSAYSGGSALLQLVPQGDRFSVKEIKTYRRELMNHHGGMVLVGDHIYFGHNQNAGNPVCVDFRTGEIVWGPEKYPTGASGSAAVPYADGRLYFRYTNRKMVLIDPSPEGLKVVSSFDLPPPSHPQKRESWPHPVIANGKLYIRDTEVMYCYNVKAETN